MFLEQGESGRSISALLVDIVDNIRHLIRGELRLAATDLRHEASKVRMAALLCAAGATLALLACGALLFSAIAALSLVWPAWAAALAVGGVAATAAGLVVVAGLRRFHRVRVPPKNTAERMRENLQWAKQRIR